LQAQIGTGGIVDLDVSRDERQDDGHQRPDVVVDANERAAVASGIMIRA
jgi:hypothetical protein